jgi:hypothetical protein
MAEALEFDGKTPLRSADGDLLIPCRHSVCVVLKPDKDGDVYV